jgi:hypothetical protein
VCVCVCVCVCVSVCARVLCVGAYAVCLCVCTHVCVNARVCANLFELERSLFTINSNLKLAEFNWFLSQFLLNLTHQLQPLHAALATHTPPDTRTHSAHANAHTPHTHMQDIRNAAHALAHTATHTHTHMRAHMAYDERVSAC